MRRKVSAIVDCLARTREFSPFHRMQKRPHKGGVLVHPARISDTLKRVPSESVAASGSHELVSSRLFSVCKNAPTREAFWCTRRGSNSQRGRRRPLFYPIRLRVHILFFKKHIYFTIFRFLFASVYGIIFSNSRKNFSYEVGFWEKP